MAIAGRRSDVLYCDDKSLTQQQFKEETDINKIVARAQQGEAIAHVNERVAQYGDFSQVPSFQEAFAFVKRAGDMFMSMDAFVRERFANDPGRMIAFIQDPKNFDEAVKLGLVKPREPAGPAAGKAVPDPGIVEAEKAKKAGLS